MLTWFDALSLRWKLTGVTVIAAAATVIVASVIMGTYDASAYKREQIGNATAESKVLAASVAASLVFNDAAAAQEYLNALVADPGVDAAAVYGADGAKVASYERAKSPAGLVPEHPGASGNVFVGNELQVTDGVVENNEAVGTVFIATHVESVFDRFARYALVLLAIGAAAIAVVLPLALWMHRRISNPLEELAARNAIINATLDSVDHGMVVVDRDMRVTFTNDRCAEIFGGAIGLHAGIDFAGFIERWHEAIAMAGAARADDLQQMRAGANARGLYALRDGRIVEYRQSAVKSGGFVRTYTDITAEKTLQDELQAAKDKAEQAATAKSQFLAAMSHEIRTPMNGVIGIVELLRATPLNGEQKQMVEIIRQSGISLLDVINDILDYSKIEAGRMTVEVTECALPEIVETTAAVVGGHTSSKFLDIVCVIDPKVDALVMGDPVRIRQVILNLMGNAIKFTQVGTVSIEAKAESITDTEMTVLFEITDTGIGISEEKQKQLFQAFAQADYSTTRRFGGTGLGLSISRNLVALMGGEIGVRSAAGMGSTFWFRIPFARLPAERRVDPFADFAQSLKGLRILMCDESRPTTVAAVYLAAAGAEVLQATDYTAAIARLQAEKSGGHPVDLAIYRIGLVDDKAGSFVEALYAGGLANTKLVFIVPHLSARSAQLAVHVASVSAPIARAKLIETVAGAAGRPVKRARATQDAATVRYNPPAIEDAVAAGSLILVAEDNQTNQFVIKSQLDRLGFAAEFVSDGQEAWHVLQRDDSRYGLLITDCHMPFVDGYQLTGLIRDRELASGRRLPVVALTANALQGEADICRAAGMDGYMFKPTNLPTLEANVLKWLPQAAQLRQGGGQGAGRTGRAAAIETHGPINLGELSRMLGSDDAESLNDMLGMYWESEAATPQDLKTLAQSRDGQGLKAAAHAAKGAAASIAAVHLADLCRALEHSAASEDWIAVDRLTTQIDYAFKDIGVFIAGARENALAV